jgi:AcrR family transcriptional regulator
MPKKKKDSTADKILKAATTLFAKNNYNHVTIVDIATLSKTNSALISYYYGGKQKLYRKTIYTQADELLSSSQEITKTKATSIERFYAIIQHFIDYETNKPDEFHLIYREFFTPTGLCENIIEKRLRKIHDFLTETANNCIKDGYFSSNSAGNYIAFTVESIIMFFSLNKQTFIDGVDDKTLETINLETAVYNYIDSLSTKKEV